jgi:D-aminoacyl-tRNA deacylase
VTSLYLIVVSEPDPVASRVVREWGTPPATGDQVDGVPIRRLDENTLELRRPGPHLYDEHLDQRLPLALRTMGPTLVFPSIHRSQQNIEGLTVHPIGNLGPRADLGGRPRTVSPTDPRSMVAVLRRLSEEGQPEGLRATFEATHHGPEIGLAGFFVEIGYGTQSEPPEAAVRLLSRALREIVPDPRDRIAFGVGGSHYAPHFTDLALRRRWAFGHIVSRHALDDLDVATARSAYDLSAGAEGILYARAQDASHSALAGLGPRLRDSDAPGREVERVGDPATRAARPSGT